MRISDWSSDVCSSDLEVCDRGGRQPIPQPAAEFARVAARPPHHVAPPFAGAVAAVHPAEGPGDIARRGLQLVPADHHRPVALRSEEHTSELQSLMRISYAVFCLKKKNEHNMTQEPRQN